jgi:hypothetical protein
MEIIVNDQTLNFVIPALVALACSGATGTAAYVVYRLIRNLFD